MANIRSAKTQLEDLKRIIARSPVSTTDRAAWEKAKSRSSFRPSSLFPPLPAIPISSKLADSKLAWRRQIWNSEAPARLVPGLLLILEQSSGSLRFQCLYCLQYLRFKHFSDFTPGDSKLPPFSNLERSLLPPPFIRLLDRRPELFIGSSILQNCSAFETAKIKHKLKDAFPAQFKPINLPPTKPNSDLTLVKEGLNGPELEAVNLTFDDSSLEGSSPVRSVSPDPSEDIFSFTELLPRPEATASRHKSGKRRSVRSTRFSEGFLF